MRFLGAIWQQASSSNELDRKFQIDNGPSSPPSKTARGHSLRREQNFSPLRILGFAFPSISFGFVPSHECRVLHEFFFVAVRLRSFDDVPFLLDRKLRHFLIGSNSGSSLAVKGMEPRSVGNLIIPDPMQEKETTIGLSWAPKVSMPSSGKKDNLVDSLSLSETSIWKAGSELVDGLYVPPREPKKLNKLLRKSMKDTTGKSWFDMPAPIITPELKTDLEILKLRNFIDPKRHFKKGDKSRGPPKYFQVGTVVEPASEFFSGRLTKKERKSTLADELLSDRTFQTYRKRKVKEVNESRRPGGVSKWKIKGKATWKRANERRGR
ncbi:hypothetical protein IEQ34_021950 [Dendrobium chrysotoxum]|uniref:Fcf2 pre-rRNA processing C-terminal domain-containing protein n=1 Tax=Dendrobium chrysotoxum TaxID=161865 RepID=A0AAV7FW54_DENCH|nr:hypothetical protein IEQ34_021950 [Dendrobium chrysotoxum]